MENLISETELAAFRAFLQGSEIKTTEVAVTSAEILALFTTAKELVPAPGSGYVNEFISAVLILDYVSAAYATNGVLTVHETDISGTAVSDAIALAAFLAKTEDWIVVVQALSADTTLTANAALVLAVGTGNTITGDSPISVRTTYRVHETGL
jgi:hypothetical protein